MAKAIKVQNSYGEVIALLDNATKAIKAIEKYSSCNIEAKLQTVTKELKESGKTFVVNVFGAVFHLEVLEASAGDIRREKQYLNAMATLAIFK
jgi:hypothetical protein